MRRVSWNLANCHATVQKLLVRQIVNKSKLWSWRVDNLTHDLVWRLKCSFRSSARLSNQLSASVHCKSSQSAQRILSLSDLHVLYSKPRCCDRRSLSCGEQPRSHVGRLARVFVHRGSCKTYSMGLHVYLIRWLAKTTHFWLAIIGK